MTTVLAVVVFGWSGVNAADIAVSAAEQTDVPIDRLSRNSTRCALQTPYNCVAVPECGFCLTSYTCMVGNASGPVYAVLCDNNVTIHGAGCAWIFERADLEAAIATIGEVAELCKLRYSVSTFG